MYIMILVQTKYYVVELYKHFKIIGTTIFVFNVLFWYLLMPTGNASDRR